MTEVRIGVDEGSVLALYQWLAEDSDVRRNTALSLAHGGRPGDMGGLEVINVVVSNVIAFSGLVVAITSWWGSRTNAPPVEIERDGVRVIVNDDSPETIQRVIEALSADRS